MPNEIQTKVPDKQTDITDKKKQKAMSGYKQETDATQKPTAKKGAGWISTGAVIAVQSSFQSSNNDTGAKVSNEAGNSIGHTAEAIRELRKWTKQVHTEKMSEADTKDRLAQDKTLKSKVEGLQTGVKSNDGGLQTKVMPQQEGTVSASFKEQGVLKSRIDKYSEKQKKTPKKEKIETSEKSSIGKEKNNNVKKEKNTVKQTNKGTQTGKTGKEKLSTKKDKSSKPKQSYGKSSMSKMTKASAVQKAASGDFSGAAKMILTKGIRAKLYLIAAIAAACLLIIALFFILISAVVSFFSGMYMRDGEEVTARDALLDNNKGIPSFREELAQDILEQNSADDPDIRRIYFNGIVTLNPDEDNIISMLPPDETMATHMEAPFIAYLFMEHGLEAGQPLTDSNINYADDYAIIREMYEKMFHIYTLTVKEWCGLSLATGAGTFKECDDCNKLHARTDCPNPDNGTHSSYKCSKCCNRQYGTFISCDGYSNCDGHTVNFTYIYYNGAAALMSDQFTIPLEKMREQGKEETTEYKDLQAFHELTIMLADMNYETYGDVLSGIRYYPEASYLGTIPTSREGCEETVNFGLTFVRPETYSRPNIFTNYAGFSDDWCAMFANYIHENVNCSKHGSAAHSAAQIRSWSTSTIMATAKARGQWADGNYTAPAPGDWILFNYRYAPGHERYSVWSTGCHHIGVVTHVDGSGNVHYVHGNTNNDRVRHDSKPLADNQIRGYVVMFP